MTPLGIDETNIFALKTIFKRNIFALTFKGLCLVHGAYTRVL